MAGCRGADGQMGRRGVEAARARRWALQSLSPNSYGDMETHDAARRPRRGNENRDRVQEVSPVSLSALSAL
eukprot:6749694-Pyramimonas_sp.AAC.1